MASARRVYLFLDSGAMARCRTLISARTHYPCECVQNSRSDRMAISRCREIGTLSSEVGGSDVGGDFSRVALLRCDARASPML